MTDLESTFESTLDRFPRELPAVDSVELEAPVRVRLGLVGHVGERTVPRLPDPGPLDGKTGLERRPVQLGAANDRYVEVCDGLAPGERILLDPQRYVVETFSLSGLIKPDGGGPNSWL